MRCNLLSVIQNVNTCVLKLLGKKKPSICLPYTLWYRSWWCSWTLTSVPRVCCFRHSRNFLRCFSGCRSSRWSCSPCPPPCLGSTPLLSLWSPSPRQLMWLVQFSQFCHVPTKTNTLNYERISFPNVEFKTKLNHYLLLTSKKLFSDVQCIKKRSKSQNF